MSIERNIRIIILYTICNSMIFLLAVVIPYYTLRGLSFQDFLLAEAVFSAVVLLSEVPSGWAADIWKRRTVLMIGMVFGIAGYSGLFFIETLWHAMIAQGLIGVTVALNSGTVTALLYDTLAHAGREGEYRARGKTPRMWPLQLGFRRCRGRFFV